MANTRRAQGAGTVVVRKDGRAMAQAMYEGKRITKYGKTKKEAWDNLQSCLDDLKKGLVVVATKQTVKEYLENWLEKSHSLELRAASLQKYRGLLRNHINPAIGHVQLSQLTRQHVQALYAQKVSEGLASKTIKVIHSILSCALKEAVRDDLLTRNVCEYAILPRMGVYEAHPFTHEECERLIEVAKSHHLWSLLLVALTTGARRGELFSLRWSDVNMVTGQVHLHRTVDRLVGLGNVENETKTVHGMRVVHLPQVALDALVEQQARIEKLSKSSFWVENSLVFPNRFGGYRDGSTVLKSMKALLRQAGLPEVRFHDLRHSAATLLLAAGVNPKVVQELLGHSSISVTLGMYGHVLPNMQKDVSNKMDDFFGQRS